jgi:AraC-like DNA-binding protein
MRKFEGKQRRIFVGFSLPFLLFIIIPVLFLNIAIWLAIRVTGQNERQNCVKLLTESGNGMDARIRDIRNMVTLLRSDGNIIALQQLDTDISARDHFSIWLALQSFGRWDVFGRGLDMILYYQNADLALGPCFMAGQMKRAWGDSFRFGNYDYSGFLSDFCFSGLRPVFFPEMDYIWEKNPLRGILYGTRLLPGGDIFVFSLLKEQILQEFFSPVFESNGALYIYDSSGTLLYSRGGGFSREIPEPHLFTGSGLLPDSFFGTGIIAAYSNSDHGLFYVSATDAGTALNRVRYLWNLTLVLNITTIVFSLGYALLLAVRNFRQVGEAFQLLDEDPDFPSYEKGNVMNYLNTSVKRLLKANVRLREDADSGKEMIRIAFLDRLLNDGWENPEEAAAAAEQSGIPVAGRRFCVVFLVTHFFEKKGEAAAGAWQKIWSDLEKALPPDEVLIYSRNPHRIGVFFFLESEHGEAFRDYIEKLFKNSGVQSSGGENFSLHPVGSGLYKDIFGIREGYKLCREYALVCNQWEDGIHWVDVVSPPRQRIFVFPPEDEQKLMNQLRNADFEGSQNTLRSAFAVNLQDNRLSERMLTIFYTNLQSCFLKSLEGPLTDLWRDAIEDLDFQRLPKEVEETFIELARSVCSSLETEHTKKNTLIKKEELTAWVEDHFDEEHLSLSFAARHFGFSETYFSQMFKNITGENFSAFAEITRLNHARGLLKQQLKVDEVAFRCGYNSANAFRRAYKRHFGVNPTWRT